MKLLLEVQAIIHTMLFFDNCTTYVGSCSLVCLYRNMSSQQWCPHHVSHAVITIWAALKKPFALEVWEITRQTKQTHIRQNADTVAPKPQTLTIVISYFTYLQGSGGAAAGRKRRGGRQSSSKYIFFTQKRCLSLFIVYHYSSFIIIYLKKAFFRMKKMKAYIRGWLWSRRSENALHLN